MEINNLKNLNVDMENESDVFITNMINHDSGDTNNLKTITNSVSYNQENLPFKTESSFKSKFGKITNPNVIE